MPAPIGNKYALGANSGRPATYKDSESLYTAVMDYFEGCNKHEIKATITGLALFLGFKSRSSFDDYKERSEEFSYIIERAKLAVEYSYESSGTAFDIFALKNMGWKDKTETGLTNSKGEDVQQQFIFTLAQNCQPIEDSNTTSK